MFYEAYSFNQSINEWNVSNVNDMSKMFACKKFLIKNKILNSHILNKFNQPLNNWNV